MKLPILGKRTSHKQRLLPILIAVVLSSGIMYYANTPQVSLSPAVPSTQAEPANLTIDPPVKKSYTPVLPTRDPFAMPSEFQPKSVVVSQGNVNKPKEISPVLTGLIMAGNSGSAIIQYGADSRSYRTGDFVGPNQVTAISKNTVTLQGPNGTLVLSIGR